MKRFEEIPHTADIAAVIYGRDTNELFENAALAMFSMMADLEGLGTDHVEAIKIEAPDRDSLLILWLNELLNLFNSKKAVFREFHVRSMSDTALTAEAAGTLLKSNLGCVKKEIKAATYHDVRIEKKGRLYRVTVVFDV